MKHVLVVDENAENRRRLRVLLQENGYTVEEARHGSDALQRARRKIPDVVISDLLLPVLDGYSLLRQWKSDPRLNPIPFVVYTATYTGPKDGQVILDLGADAFLAKPAEPERLMACVRNVLTEEHLIEVPVRGLLTPQSSGVSDHSEALVRKLEKKAERLKQANRKLLDEIAEHKRTETALRGSEDRYRTLFDSISDPLFVFDCETLVYLAVNDAAVRAYGYSREELLQMNVTDIRPAEDVPPLMAALANSGTGAEKRGLWRHRKKNGELITVDISTSRTEFVGRPALIVQARDVTEQRRVQAEVERTAELLRAVAEGTTDAVFVKDRSGKYLLFNKAAAQYVNVSVSEVLGKDDTEIFPPADAAVIMKNDRRVMENNRVESVEELLHTANGARTFSALKVPYRDGEGNVIGLIGISRDVSEQKRAEAALRLRDRAIQAVSQGILITDPNLPDNPIVFVSAGFERITGYSPEEAIGRNCRFLQGSDTDPAALSELRNAIQETHSCSVEILNYRKDGTPFWNQLTISPVLGLKGELTHFVGVQTDVTDRKRLEEQFLQAQKMEAVGQLAGGLAHDFNNLITVITGYSEILLNSIAPDDGMRTPLSEICKAGERAARLTRQLLAFSRQQLLEPKLLDLNLIVAEAESMLHRLIGEDIILVTKLNSNIGLVRADAGQLEQVLLNLAVNARDAMPQGGRLTIETHRLELDSSYCQSLPDVTPGDYIGLTVTDTGEGMNAATRSRIFEPFYTTKAVGKGTGLGLATVHGIVKQSRGHVTVYSEVDYGTTFKVYLPEIPHPKQVARPTANSNSLPRGNETLLLVEDEHAVRDIAGRILCRCGYRILEASNGVEAIRIADEEPGIIDLLVSDVVMPHLGGHPLAARIVHDRPGCKVLFLSGYTDDAIIRHGILQAEVAFLQKPFTPSSLARKVREVLDMETPYVK